MATKRKIEIFTAGCSVCNETVALVKAIACSSCDVQILDMHKEKNPERAKQYGIRSVPAVVVDGKLADFGSDTAEVMRLSTFAGPTADR